MPNEVQGYYLFTLFIYLLYQNPYNYFRYLSTDIVIRGFVSANGTPESSDIWKLILLTLNCFLRRM